MSKLTRDDVLKLARLARLRLSDDEVTQFQHEISEILQYVEMLQEVDLSRYKPTSQVTGLTNVTRADDEIDYGTTQKALLQNFPAVEDKHNKVRRMIG